MLRRLQATLALCLLPSLSLAGATSMDAPWAPLPAPSLDAAPAGVPGTSRAAQLRPAGYLEQEFILQGQARRYAPLPGWGHAGRWDVGISQAAQPFATRLLVRRPQDPRRFNGIVVVEWLNTTPGYDLDGGWILTRDELIAEGYAWVGVSAQREGLQALRQQQPTRYAPTRIDSDAWSHDIFTQTGQALRQHAARMLGTATSTTEAPIKPTLLGLGYSQSGMFLYTYINTFQPLARVFDGFYLRGPAPIALPVDDGGSPIWGPALRSDLTAPVMQVQTEMEAMVSWPLSRTPDTDKVRYWEIAGAAHLDGFMQAEMPTIIPPAFQAPRPQCLKPANTLPAPMIDHAALHALRMWVRTGQAPPMAPRLQRNALGWVQSDDAGNALGGVRLPELTVPMARYGMYSNISTDSLRVRDIYACMAGGSTTPFSPQAVHQRYPSRLVYLQRYRAAADALLASGFLRPADHARALRQAADTAWPP